MNRELSLEKNRKIKLGIISIYPPRGRRYPQFGGVASYTKNLASSLNKEKIEVRIYANRINKIYSRYSENGVDIVRCWDKGNFYTFQIWRNIIRDKPHIIHIQHEFFLYGGVFSAIVFLGLLFLIKLTRIPKVVTVHGIVSLSEVNGDFIRRNRMRGDISPLIVKAGFFILTKAIVILSTKVIVHEKEFLRRLEEEYKCEVRKISVIPHGIEYRNDRIDGKVAKKILGFSDKKVILYFGYITGYKGIDLLIDSFKLLINNHSDYILIIAGGQHPRLKNLPSYHEYLSNLYKKAKAISPSQIIFTGFIQEEKIPLYFSGADVVVLPYTTAMSSSGPLTFAVSYNRPFLVSESLEKLVEVKDLIFKFNPKSLAEKIEEFFKNTTLQEKALEYVQQLKEERSWEKVGKKTCRLYDTILIDKEDSI